MTIVGWELIEAVLSFCISLIVLFTGFSIVVFVYLLFRNGLKWGAARAALETDGGREMLAAVFATAIIVSVLIAIGTVDMTVLFDKPSP